jgi:hypothetical protein
VDQGPLPRGARVPPSQRLTAEVSFRRPILLPGRVEFGSSASEGRIDFFVRDAKKHTPHLEGSIK